MQKKIIKINKLLIERFGIPERPAIPPDPVDMLIATILSQNTNDRNSYRAFQNLKAKFKTWEEVARITPSEIEKYIKVAGLGKQKSKAIKSFLADLIKQNGKISLNYLKKKNESIIIDELTRFDGVGIKTASCVLLFSLHRNVCPVDTHVHRTTNRIGIVNTSSPDKTFHKLNTDFPKNIAHSFHTNLIRLGREICKPSKPNCSECPLLTICKFEAKNLSGTSRYKTNSFMLLDNVK